MLEAPAVRRTDFRQEVDVAAERDAAVVVAREHGQLLVFRHGPLIQIRTLVRFEARAVVGLHQRHAEAVEVITLAREVGVEDRRAGDA